jgi:hypothetical protein
MNINFLQIVGLILFAVGLVRLLYLISALRKGFRTSGRVVTDKKKQGSSLTNHPRVEFEDQKKKRLVMDLKVSKSFVDVHAKEGRLDIVYYEGRIFHPNEVYSSLIIPGIGVGLLLLGWYF